MGYNPYQSCSYGYSLSYGRMSHEAQMEELAIPALQQAQQAGKLLRTIEVSTSRRVV